MSTALARADAFTDEQIEVIKRSIAPKASDDELKLFLAVCQRTGLDPFTRQIYSIRRRQYNPDTRQYEEQSVTQIGIDGARLIAERSGKYEGQEGPFWCGPDGIWTDYWLKPEPPAAAKVLIYKKGARVPTTGIAHWAESVQTTKDGQPNQFWKRMPAGQLAKCAETNGLRRAFPQELSGMHVEDEAEAPAGADYVDTTGRVIDPGTGEIKPPPAPAPKQIEQRAEPPSTNSNGTQGATPPPEPWKAWNNGDDAAAWAAGRLGQDAAAMLDLYNIFKGGLKPPPKRAWDVFKPWFAHVNELAAAAEAAADGTVDGEYKEVDFGMGKRVPTGHAE